MRWDGLWWAHFDEMSYFYKDQKCYFALLDDFISSCSFPILIISFPILQDSNNPMMIKCEKSMSTSIIAYRSDVSNCVSSWAFLLSASFYLSYWLSWADIKTGENWNPNVNELIWWQRERETIWGCVVLQSMKSPWCCLIIAYKFKTNSRGSSPSDVNPFCHFSSGSHTLLFFANLLVSTVEKTPIY